MLWRKNDIDDDAFGVEIDGENDAVGNDLGDEVKCCDSR
jgi:hypothetical protein